MTTDSPLRGQLIELAEELDHSDMNRVIERIPVHIELALQHELPALPTRGVRGPFRRVLVPAMGGSALPVDVVTAAFAPRVPIVICRHYELPDDAGEDDLVIASSFSGDTEEVLSAIDSLPKGASNVVAISAGGKLLALAEQRGYPAIRIPIGDEPDGFQPRSAVGFFVSYFCRVLAAAGVLDSAAVAALEKVPAFLRAAPIRDEAEAVAQWVGDSIPLVYSAERDLDAVARIAKIKFNENAKRPAFFNALPEANHNEMIGFMKPIGDYALLFVHDPDSHPSVLKRFEVMRDAFASEGLSNVRFRTWRMPGASRVERLFGSLAFAERCSYALALLDGQDPTPVKLVQDFKRMLADRSS